MKKLSVFIAVGIFICCAKGQGGSSQMLTLKQKAESFPQNPCKKVRLCIQQFLDSNTVLLYTNNIKG